MLRKVNQDPFSNGSEFADWEERNCSRCVKASRYKGETYGEDDYTKGRCSIQRDIIQRMFSKEPIAQRTIDVCRKAHCPFKKESYEPRKKKSNSNEPTLF